MRTDDDKWRMKGGRRRGDKAAKDGLGGMSEGFEGGFTATRSSSSSSSHAKGKLADSAKGQGSSIAFFGVFGFFLCFNPQVSEMGGKEGITPPFFKKFGVLNAALIAVRFNGGCVAYTLQMPCMLYV